MMKKFPRILAEKSYSQFKIEKNEKNDKTAHVRFELQTSQSEVLCFSDLVPDESFHCAG